MIRRCTDRQYTSYHNYGGRGIKVCDRWLESFENFLNDIGERPSKEHSIDRINNDGDYKPDNCRWATAKEQGRNKRNNFIVSYKGVEKPLSEWCEHLGLVYRDVYVKIKRGSTIIDAFENLNKHKTKILLDTKTGVYYEGLKDASECLKINKATLGGYLTGKWGNKTNLIYV